MSPRDPKAPPLHVVPSMREPDQASRGGLAMVCSPAEATRRLQEMQAFVQSAMVAGVDFMVVPGTADKRPTLLQPGAQKLAELYGFSHRFQVSEAVKDWQAGFFYFEIRCVLLSRADGGIVGEGIGSCNSKESKYGQRWVSQRDVPSWLELARLPRESRPRWVTRKDVPAGVDLSTLKREIRTSRYDNGPSTYDVFQIPVDLYAIPNEDPFSIVNTLQKMAAKRAYVHAVLSVTRCSGLFTQDQEDKKALPPEAFGVVDEERPWEREREPPPAYVAPVTAHVVREPIVDRDVKPQNIPVPSNAYTAPEQKAMRELDPALKAATRPEEVEVLRKEAVAAVAGKPPTPRYLAWYESAVRSAQIRVGAS